MLGPEGVLVLFLLLLIIAGYRANQLYTNPISLPVEPTVDGVTDGVNQLMFERQDRDFAVIFLDYGTRTEPIQVLDHITVSWRLY